MRCSTVEASIAWFQSLPAPFSDAGANIAIFFDKLHGGGSIDAGAADFTHYPELHHHLCQIRLVHALSQPGCNMMRLHRGGHLGHDVHFCLVSSTARGVLQCMQQHVVSCGQSLGAVHSRA